MYVQYKSYLCTTTVEVPGVLLLLLLLLMMMMIGLVTVVAE